MMDCDEGEYDPIFMNNLIVDYVYLSNSSKVSIIYYLN
jgi:hypothetical protein